MGFDFTRLQDEVNNWARKNFGDTPPHRPLLGAMEELGELSHAHLKMEQGIRGTPAEHVIAKKDAIGDVVIYLADYCARNGLSLQECVEGTWNRVKQRNWVADPQSGGEGKVS